MLAAQKQRTDLDMLGSAGTERDLLYTDDAAKIFMALALQSNFSGIVNVGSGQNVTMGEVTALLAQIIGFNGALSWQTIENASRPRLDLTVLRETLPSDQMPRMTALDKGLSKTFAHLLARLPK
jgi:GDP-L-fucose synthase